MPMFKDLFINKVSQKPFDVHAKKVVANVLLCFPKHVIVLNTHLDNVVHFVSCFSKQNPLMCKKDKNNFCLYV